MGNEDPSSGVSSTLNREKQKELNLGSLTFVLSLPLDLTCLSFSPLLFCSLSLFLLAFDLFDSLFLYRLYPKNLFFFSSLYPDLYCKGFSQGNRMQ
jgi:hypothetical protein